MFLKNLRIFCFSHTTGWRKNRMETKIKIYNLSGFRSISWCWFVAYFDGVCGMTVFVNWVFKINAKVFKTSVDVFEKPNPKCTRKNVTNRICKQLWNVEWVFCFYWILIRKFQVFNIFNIYFQYFDENFIFDINHWKGYARGHSICVRVCG